MLGSYPRRSGPSCYDNDNATFKSLWSYFIMENKCMVKECYYLFKQTKNQCQLLFCDVGYVTIRISINSMQLKNISSNKEL